MRLMKMLSLFFMLMLLLCLPLLLQAQTPDAPLQNIYGVGLSFNSGANSPVAGTGLYAHAIGTSGTYAFGVFDALPNTTKPFTVTSNTGVGIAQKVMTIGSVPIYVPTAAGVSWTGSNTGWSWSTGALGVIHLKKDWYLLPNIRVAKSSVSGSTGYQPIGGFILAWGK